MGFTNEVIPEISEERKAIEEANKVLDKKIDILTKTGDEVLPPLSGYKDINKVPYSAKYFNLDYYEALDDKTDVNRVKSKVKNVEDFINEEIKLRKMDDSIKSYDFLVNKILEVIGDDYRNDKLLARVSKYIDMVQAKRAKDRNFQKMMKDTGMDYFMKLEVNNG